MGLAEGFLSDVHVLFGKFLMGTIDIATSGSFGHKSKRFGPADHGHVDVVAELLEWVATELLPHAHVIDHEIHDEGTEPPSGWDRKRKVGS